MQSVAREGVSPEQVSQLIAKNPLVAVEFVREFVRMEKEGILTCDEEEGKWLKPAGTSPGGAPKKAGILSQLWRETPSVSLCHVIGAFLRSGDVSREFFEAAAAALAGKLAGIAGEGVRRHVAQCFCFLVAGMWREGLVEEKVGMAGWWDVAAARGCEEGERGGAGHRGGGLRGGADEWGIGREVTCLFERSCVCLGIGWNGCIGGQCVVIKPIPLVSKQKQQPMDTYEMLYRSMLLRVISLYTSDDAASYFFTFFIVMSRRLTSRYRSSWEVDTHSKQGCSGTARSSRLNST